MKPIDVFLAELGERNIRIALDGEQLRITPRSALSAEIVEQLHLRKPEIVQILRQSGGKAYARTIRPTPREGALPLSYAQERLWFLNQLEGDNAAYNMPMPLRLSGDLDVAALEGSLREIVRRHEILRTTFVNTTGQPAQVISEPIFHLPIFDITGSTSEDRAAAARLLAAEDARRPFDLAEGPLLRATLFRLCGSTEHVLLLDMHHIVSDAWSMGVFARELSALYAAFRVGEPSPLPDLPIQYADFAVWQRAWLSGDIMAEQLAYWKRKLAGAPPTLRLPSDTPRPSQQTFKGGCCARRLPKNATGRLLTLSQKKGVTLFVTLLAAWKLLLARLSGDDDIVVGTVVAGRNQIELEGLIGFFLNSLVLRTDLSGNPTFVELLQRVRRVTLEAFAHQDVPFEKLVAELQPARDLGHSPLFQNLFNMVPPQARALQLPGLEVERAVDIDDERAKLDLTLYVTEAADGLDLRAVYNAELFSAARIVHVVDQYHHLLDQIGHDPTQPINTYSLVTSGARALLPDMRARLLEPEYPPVTSLIAGWAERTPEQSAVVQGERSWSYRELVQEAVGVMNGLQEGGLRQGEVVAIQGVQSFGLVAGMLGALAGGGVLLLLEPRLPARRLEVMLEEAGARRLILLSSDEPGAAWLSARFPGALHVNPLCGADRPPRGDTPPKLPAPPPDAPSHVFFTSGTTGAPKGVLGVHKGIAHFLRWQSRTWGITAADRAAQLINVSFDPVLRDIFLPLVSGASLVLPPVHEVMDGRRLLDWLEQERITLLHTVPSLAEAWLADAPEGRSLPGLRYAFFCGEPLLDQLVSRWRTTFPRCRVVNLYGPTETTMAKCFYEVPEVPLPGVQPVGYPLPETQALVLRGSRLCGVGEPGEIAIRTPFRTRGYLNNPDEHRRRFQRNPCTDDVDDLVYHTGDVGRYRLDGSTDILGRLDDQVKIRGVRVELREIESALCRHPAVRQAVVVTDGEGSDKRLVAYVVPRGDAESGVEVRTRPALRRSVLRRYLQEKLPGYMIPAAFVVLDDLPLSPNGKVDRRALPAPSASGEQGHASVAPRNPQELKLVQIWESVLGVSPIGVRDNFFDLGGHSLLAVRLLTKQKERLGQDLPLGVFFQHPTVEAVALLLELPRDTELWAPLVAIQPNGSRPPFFCLPGGYGDVLYLYALAHHLGDDQPFFGLRSVGLSGVTPPYTTMEAVVDRYIAEVRCVQPRGPYYLGGHSWGGMAAFAMAQRLLGAGEQVQLLAIFDSNPPGMDPSDRLEWNEDAVIAEMIEHLEVHHEMSFGIPRERLTALTSEERLVLLRDCLERADRLPAGTDLAEVRGRVQVYRASLRMRYTPDVAAPISLVYFAAAESGDASIQRRVGGWSRVNPVTVEVVPGGHLSMLEEPHVRRLGRALAARLGELLP